MSIFCAAFMFGYYLPILCTACVVFTQIQVYRMAILLVHRRQMADAGTMYFSSNYFKNSGGRNALQIPQYSSLVPHKVELFLYVASSRNIHKILQL